MSVDVAAKFKEAEIVPNIIPNAPTFKLDLQYESVPVEVGASLHPKELRSAPRVSFNVNPEALYTLCIIDPDNLSRAKPTVAEWVHWLMVNIPAHSLKQGTVGGKNLMAYGSPAPAPRTGPHRYVALIWEHAGRKVNHPVLKARQKFSVKEFQQKHNLGDPIAGNFFFSQNESQ